MKAVRSRIEGNKIWISIDGTTDSAGRFVANVIVCTLNADAPGDQVLLNSEELEKTNNSTIARLFIKSTKILGDARITDAIPYMRKAAKALTVIHPKIIHLTCLAHALHRVAKLSVISTQTSILYNYYSKCLSRIQALLEEVNPNVPLPPRPSTVRRGIHLF